MTVPVTYLQGAQFNSIIQSAMKLGGVDSGEQLGLLGCLVFLLVLRAVTAGEREEWYSGGFGDKKAVTSGWPLKRRFIISIASILLMTRWYTAYTVYIGGEQFTRRYCMSGLVPSHTCVMLETFENTMVFSYTKIALHYGSSDLGTSYTTGQIGSLFVTMRVMILTYIVVTWPLHSGQMTMKYFDYHMTHTSLG